jgi:hypothetical protein
MTLIRMKSVARSTCGAHLKGWQWVSQGLLSGSFLIVNVDRCGIRLFSIGLFWRARSPITLRSYLQSHL